MQPIHVASIVWHRSAAHVHSMNELNQSGVWGLYEAYHRVDRRRQEERTQS